MNVHNTNPFTYTYTPYGHRTICTSRLGFKGDYQDQASGLYPLGNGHRMYNPILMRFNSPDALSPFAEGGINTYMLCAGDPINLTDHSGRSFLFDVGVAIVKGLQRAPARLLRKGVKGAIKHHEQLQENASDDNARQFKNSPDRLLLSLTPDQAFKSPEKNKVAEYESPPGLTARVKSSGLDKLVLVYPVEQSQSNYIASQGDEKPLTAEMPLIRNWPAI